MTLLEELREASPRTAGRLLALALASSACLGAAAGLAVVLVVGL